MRVAGLDLARRRDHSALVLLDVEPDRLTVTAALRLPQAPLRQQFALIAPHLAGLDLLVFDQSGLGDAAAELLPKTPPHIGVCLIGGDRPLARSAQGRSTILRALRRQAISSRLSAFTASSASSRQRPVKGKPSREAAWSVAISKTVQPSRSARKSKGRSMGKLQLVRGAKATQSPGRSDGQTEATLGRERGIACMVS